MTVAAVTDPAAIHISVMLEEVMGLLQPAPGRDYLDGTLGMGGHGYAILSRAGRGARLLGLDRDEQALELAARRLEPFGDAAVLRHAPFSRFGEVLDALGWDGVDGALVDLGVSSLQLDDPERGFSFLRDGELDMRMDPGSGEPSAADVVNDAPFETLRDLIRDLGEEPQAGRIAKRIVLERAKKPFATTAELARTVEEAYPAAWRRTARNHPATRTFQALRMHVNRELDELAAFLEEIPARLRPGGRVAVISFHSLEDRMVKQAFRREADPCTCPKSIPYCVCGKVARLKIVTKKPLIASEDEVRANPRSRSAKLRAAERLPAGEAA